MGDVKEKAVKSIFKGGAIFFLGTLFSKIFGLAYRIMVGNFLGPEQYGIISTMMSIFSAALIIGEFGITEGVQKFVAKYRGLENPSRIKGSLLASRKMVIVSSLITSAILMLANPILTQIFNESSLVWPIRMVAVSIPFMAITQVYINFWEAYEKMKYTIYTIQIGNNIIKIIATSIFLVIGLGYLGAALGFTLAFIFSFFLAHHFYKKTIPEEVAKSSPKYNYKEIFSHSWPLMTGGLASIITTQIDTFMIQSLLGSTSTGLYNAAYPIGMLITGFAGIFGSIFLSNASKLIETEEKTITGELYQIIVKWTELLTVPIFLALFAFPQFALIIFGTEFNTQTVRSTLRVLSLGFFLSAIIGPIGNIYQAFDNTKLNLYSSIILGFINGVANFFLINSFGILGAAYATLLGFLTINVYHLYNFYNLTGTTPFRKSSIKIIFSGLSSILGVLIISNILFESTPLWFVPLAIVIYSLTYLMMILFTKTLEEFDIIIIKSIIREVGHNENIVDKWLSKYSQS